MIDVSRERIRDGKNSGKWNVSGDAMLGLRRMKLWGVGVATLLVSSLVGCGGNSTKVAVTISPTTATVVERGTQQFSAVGSGSTTTTVNWQICLPPATAGNQPTNCTPLPGQSGTGPTGVGTITQATATQAGGLYTAPS